MPWQILAGSHGLPLVDTIGVEPFRCTVNQLACSHLPGQVTAFPVLLHKVTET